MPKHKPFPEEAVLQASLSTSGGATPTDTSQGDDLPVQPELATRARSGSRSGVICHAVPVYASLIIVSSVGGRGEARKRGD